MSFTLYKKITVIILTVILSFFVAKIALKPDQGLTMSKPALMAAVCGQNLQCLAQSLANIMESEGIQAGLNEINSFSEISKIHCHAVSHAAGKEMYKRVGEKILTVYEDLCDGGFTHGWMADIGQGLSDENIINIFGDYCRNSPAATACQHGIGHALGENNTSIKKASEICLKTSGVAVSQHPVKSVAGSCVEGWMMEKRNSFSWEDEKSLQTALLLCDPLENSLKIYCTGQAYRLWAESNNSLKLDRVYPLSKYCDSLKSLSFQICTIYLGEAIATIPLLTGDIETTITGTNIYCSLENKDNRCLDGVLFVLSAGWEDNDSRLFELCSSLKKELIEKCRKITNTL